MWQIDPAFNRSFPKGGGQHIESESGVDRCTSSRSAVVCCGAGSVVNWDYLGFLVYFLVMNGAQVTAVLLVVLALGALVISVVAIRRLGRK